MIKLSICIPCYNRKTHIRETLDLLLSQVTSEVEIIVVDNASDDGTQEILKEYQRLSLIKLKFQKENVGADLNYLEVVNSASGEYCWLFGSDDKIEAGSLREILSFLNEYEPDLVFLNQKVCNDLCKRCSPFDVFDEKFDVPILNSSKREDALKYFEAGQSHSALGGYLSVLIFKRNVWNAVASDIEFIGSLYVHTDKIFQIVKNGCEIGHIKKPLVHWRGGNDSFGGKGKIFQRYFIDFEGFKKLIDKHYKDDRKVSSLLKSVFRRHHRMRNIAYLRLNSLDDEWWKVKEYFYYYEYPLLLYYILQTRGIKIFLKLAHISYRLYNRRKIG